MTKAIKKKSEDMGSRPMFEWYIWMNNMHDVVIVLTEYELYPIIDACCATLAPQFSTLHQCNPTYPNCNFQLATPTWEATRNSIKWSERTRRTFNITRLKGSLPISDWVPFFANYIIHIVSHEVTRKRFINMELKILSQIRTTSALSTIST